MAPGTAIDIPSYVLVVARLISSVFDRLKSAVYNECTGAGILEIPVPARQYSIYGNALE